MRTALCFEHRGARLRAASILFEFLLQEEDMFPVLVHLVKQMKWFVTHTDNLRRARLLDRIQEKSIKFYSETLTKRQQLATTTDIETSRVITNTVTVCSY